MAHVVATRVLALHEEAGDIAAIADWLKALPGSPRCFALPPSRQDAGHLGSKCRELETPTIAQLLDLCLAMESHLEQQPSNVVVVLCQGSCRAALMLLSAYLLVKGIVKQPAAAAKAVLAKLPCSLPAAQPSELRYLRQVLVTLEAGAGAEVPEQPLHLRTLKLQGAPSRWRSSLEIQVLTRPPGAICAAPVACFKAGQGMAVVGRQAVVALPAFHPGIAAVGDLGLHCLLEGDVLIEVMQNRGRQGSTLLCSVLFPVTAVQGLQLSLSRQQLDRVHADIKAGAGLVLTFDAVPEGVKDGRLRACKLHALPGLAEDSPPSSPSSIPAVSSPEQQAHAFPEGLRAPPSTPQQLRHRQRAGSLDEASSSQPPGPGSSWAREHLGTSERPLRSPFNTDDEGSEGPSQPHSRNSLAARAESMPPSQHQEYEASLGFSRRTASVPAGLHRSSLFVRALSAAHVARGRAEGGESTISAPVTPSYPRPEASMDWAYDSRAAVLGAAEELQQLVEVSRPQAFELPPLALAEVDAGQAAALIKWMAASWWLSLV